MSRIRTAKGEAVTYLCDMASIDITHAVPANQQRRGAQGEGVAVDVNSQDWLIDVAMLAVDSVAVIPKRGHRIKWDHGTTISLYEVLPQDGDAVFHYSDSLRTQFRIHTKRMEGAVDV